MIPAVKSALGPPLPPLTDEVREAIAVPAHLFPHKRIYRSPRLNYSLDDVRGSYSPVLCTLLPAQSFPTKSASEQSMAKDHLLAYAKPMLCYVQILTTPTADTPGPALLLHTDKRRYVVGNLGEGLQRAVFAHRIPMARTSDVFLSGPIDWRTVGGLLGMVLTLSDMQATSKLDSAARDKKHGAQRAGMQLTSLKLHGGPNLLHMLGSARNFVYRRGMDVRPYELREDPGNKSGRAETRKPDYSDDSVQVWHVPLVAERARPAAERKSSGSHAHEDQEKENLSASSSCKSARRKRNYDDFSQKDATARFFPENTTEEGGRNDQSEMAMELRRRVVDSCFGHGSSQDLQQIVQQGRLPGRLLPSHRTFYADETFELQKGPPPAHGSADDGDAPDPSASATLRTFLREPWNTLAINLPPTRPASVSMSYVMRLHRRRGKFDVAAAHKLGVVRTDFGKLTARQSVTLEDGTVVTPDMVLAPDVEGTGIAVVDVPSVGYLDSLLGRPEFAEKDIMTGVSAIYYILRAGKAQRDSQDDWIVRDPRFTEFMRRHPDLKHILLAEGLCPNHTVFEGAATRCIMLHRIDPTRFPLPVYSNRPADHMLQEWRAAGLDVALGQVGGTLQLAPRVIFQDEKIVPPFDPSHAIGEIQSREKVLELAEAARRRVGQADFQTRAAASNEGLPSLDTEIVTLGTGSAVPSKHRNVSSTLVRVPGVGNYLLDCGENTLGQLRRAFGFEGADEVIRNLKAIYVSHQHADHHLGIVSLLARFSALHRPEDGRDIPKLAIIAHLKYAKFLGEYNDVEDFGFSSHVFAITLQKPRHSGPKTHFHLRPPPTPTFYADNFGLADICTIIVDHCHGASAGVLTLTSGLRIAYSGDCRPSDAFARAGRGAHLLVHECTLEDAFAEDARLKKHCTMSEALGVARDMAARRVVFTHFSQRYHRFPVLVEETEEERRGDMVVLYGLDLMRVRLGEFREAVEFLPALQELYDESAKEEEEEEEEDGVSLPDRGGV